MIIECEFYLLLFIAQVVGFGIKNNLEDEKQRLQSYS